MKVTNNINLDLKEDIDKHLQKISQLQMLVDDSDKIIETAKAKMSKKFSKKLLAKDKEVKFPAATNQRSTTSTLTGYPNYQGDYGTHELVVDFT